jgi:tetratricopeptide (TPR) repeat protein
MTDWYRRNTWTKADEEDFFAKLNRARKEGRPQYLKIQAGTLVATKDLILLKVAETLIQKLFSDYPDDRLERSPSFKILGDIYRCRDDFHQAMAFYKQAIDFEETFPNVLTQSYLDFSELAVKPNAEEHYPLVEKIVSKRIEGSLFPLEKYKAFSILSIINNSKGDKDKAEQFALLAEQNASAETSGLRYHKYLGVVTKRDTFLDKLVKRR